MDDDVDDDRCRDCESIPTSTMTTTPPIPRRQRRSPRAMTRRRGARCDDGEATTARTRTRRWRREDYHEDDNDNDNDNDNDAGSSFNHRGALSKGWALYYSARLPTLPPFRLPSLLSHTHRALRPHFLPLVPRLDNIQSLLRAGIDVMNARVLDCAHELRPMRRQVLLWMQMR